MAIQTPQISPEDYRNTLSQVHLQGVHLHELKTRCHNRVTGEIKINISTHADVEQEKSELQLKPYFKIVARNAEVDLFTIEMTFAVLFTAPEDLSEAFIEVFIASNLNLTVFPYVRELVASLTSRMGLPALTLPYVLNQYEKPPAKPKPRARKKKAAG